MSFIALFRIDVSHVLEVAKVQHRIGPLRAGIAIILGLLSLSPLGIETAALWLVAMLGCELWTSLATRPALSGQMSEWQVFRYVMSGLVAIPCWNSLGVLYWLSDVEGAAIMALMLWAAQLIYTQRFIYQSLPAIIIGNSSTIAAMVALPIIAPHFGSSIQIILVVGMTISIGFALSGAMMTMNNVHSLTRQKAAVEYGATHDMLTGLVNRTVFQEKLHIAIAQQQRYAVLFIDLDHFKHVNDTLGHQSGDALLEEFSDRLRRAVPSDAVAARFGGDEFAILLPLPETNDQLAAICTSIIAAAQRRFAVPGGIAEIGASIGAAITPDHGEDINDLMHKADLALYASKSAGRGAHHLFNARIEQADHERNRLESELRAILSNGSGLELHYQPRVDCFGRFQSVEAFLRWNHQDLGYIETSRIIELAEETGLIIPLGQWILRTALDFAARWPDLTVAINIAPAQLQSGEFLDWAITQTAAVGVAPSHIEFEVTETVLLDKKIEKAQTLAALRNAGFSITLDNFGTGYASIRHLDNQIFDRIKIDRSFLYNLSGSASAQAIVQAIIQLSHAMGLQVTATGVETIEQCEFLRQAGADEMQGIEFAAIMSEVNLHAVINKRRNVTNRVA